MEKRLNIRATINGLAVGESKSFPIPEYNYESVKVTCRNLRIATGKSYRCKLNPAESKARILTITRVK